MILWYIYKTDVAKVSHCLLKWAVNLNILNLNLIIKFEFFDWCDIIDGLMGFFFSIIEMWFWISFLSYKMLNILSILSETKQYSDFFFCYIHYQKKWTLVITFSFNTFSYNIFVWLNFNLFHKVVTNQQIFFYVTKIFSHDIFNHGKNFSHAVTKILVAKSFFSHNKTL